MTRPTNALTLLLIVAFRTNAFAPIHLTYRSNVLAIGQTATTPKQPPLWRVPIGHVSVVRRNALSPVAAVAAASVTSPTVTLVYALIHIVLGALGTPIVVRATSTWYRKIVLPQWTPPNRIFAPVWTILYASMGIALSRIVPRLGSPWWQTPVGAWWLVHMGLNVAWAPVFFGMKRLRIGLAMNYALLATLCGCILPEYAVLDRVSAALLIPYVVWLLFATALNQAICQRNPVMGKGAYNNAMFQADLMVLQRAAAEYAGV